MPSTTDLLALQGSTGYEYQRWSLDQNGLIVPGEKMTLKLQALGTLFPDRLEGQRVLDLGSQLGFWCFLAAQRGAQEAVGVEIKGKRLRWARQYRDAWERETGRVTASGVSFVDDISHTEGPFDTILCMSVYHHLYKTKPDHDWWGRELSRRLARKGVVIWEGPLDGDYVTERIFGERHRSIWRREEITASWDEHFHDWTHWGPALHTPGREVFVLWK